MMAEPLHELTALEQSAAIRRGELSCTTLTEHYLARIAERNETVGALITVLGESALIEAEQLDRRLREVASDEPLFGVPLPIKDLDPVAGVRCTFGSAVFDDFVSPDDAAHVTAIREAGMVVVGKSNTPEFGFPNYTENRVAPPARTPWDLQRSAGGSSGGAAAAVAAGLCSVAVGSDGGGSIRIPASATGLVGIKPSRGRVSPAPTPMLPGELAVHGPLARTVADAAALLDVLAGSAPGDFFPAPPGGGFLSAAHRVPRPLRVGWFLDPLIADTTVVPDAIAAVARTTSVLKQHGHEVLEIPAPDVLDVVGHFEVIWSVLAASLPIDPNDRDRLMPLTGYLMDWGARYSGADLARSISAAREVQAKVSVALNEYDVIVCPTLAQLPSPVGAIRDDADPAGDFDAQKRFSPHTAVFNVTGQPVISAPVHLTDEGLPVGVQLVGRYGEEEVLISVAAQLEREFGWDQRRPAFW